MTRRKPHTVEDRTEKFNQLEACEFWDEDGCYCVCGSVCSCKQPIVNVGDELHSILKEAIEQTDRLNGVRQTNDEVDTDKG